jgi:hypothetical protein
LKITIPHEDHTTVETWEPLGIHCPGCGSESTYHDPSAYDVDMRESHFVCLDCRVGGYGFHYKEANQDELWVIHFLRHPDARQIAEFDLRAYSSMDMELLSMWEDVMAAIITREIESVSAIPVIANTYKLNNAVNFLPRRPL